MNETYDIFTDTAADLPAEYRKSRRIKALELCFRFEGEDREYTEKDMDTLAFYGEMRQGRVARTAAVNVEQFAAAFEESLKEGRDVLYIGFSSGLSNTYNASRLAAERLRGSYPERRIYTVDSLCASAGQGLLVHMAADKRDEGADLDTLLQYVRETAPTVGHWFTVDDLVYLKRGGRVSPTAAFFGNMLGIKPVLHVDDEGHLIPMAKVRGRRTSVMALLEKYMEFAQEPGKTPIFISQADCLGDAELLEKALADRCGAKVSLITQIGPVIGAHSGPGTLAIFFASKER